jgi:pilus assembly protein CpaB
MALLIAVGAGVAGIALLYAHMRSFEKEASGGDPVPVLIASKEIPLGAAITEEMLAVRDLPEAYVEERHIRVADSRKVIGVRVNTAVQANESLLWSDLATGGARRNLSGLIQSGKRAVTVRGEDGTLNSLVRPGDRVDLLLTAERGTQAVTVPLLQNLLVLAVGDDLGNGTEGATTPSNYSRNAVTLGVTLAQAQLISIATSRGKLTPVLRNPADIAVIDDLPETTAADLMIAEKLADPRARSHRTEKPPTPLPSVAAGKEIERVH